MRRNFLESGRAEYRREAIKHGERGRALWGLARCIANGESSGWHIDVRELIRNVDAGTHTDPMYPQDYWRGL